MHMRGLDCAEAKRCTTKGVESRVAFGISLTLMWAGLYKLGPMGRNESWYFDVVVIVVVVITVGLTTVLDGGFDDEGFDDEEFDDEGFDNGGGR